MTTYPGQPGYLQTALAGHVDEDLGFKYSKDYIAFVHDHHLARPIPGEFAAYFKSDAKNLQDAVVNILNYAIMQADSRSASL